MRERANRVRCFAVALYGPHVSGTDLDSNERAMLARLGDHAANCFAQIENQGLRKRVATLEHVPSAQVSRSGPGTGQ
jgi:cell division septal protein FtsQ